METDDFLLLVQKGGARITIPFAQILTKTQSVGMLDGNLGGAYTHTKMVNPKLRDWVQTINEARLKVTEADVTEWKKYEEARLIEEAKQKKETEEIARKNREYEASPAGIAERKTESRKMYRNGLIAVGIFVMLIVGLLKVTHEKSDEFPTVGGDGATLKNSGPDWSKPYLGAHEPNWKASTPAVKPKNRNKNAIAEKPTIHQTFVRFRFPSGQLLLLRLENPSQSATKSFSASVGDTVSFERTRVNSYGDEWYEFVLPDNREGRNLRNGVIIAKFDSLVYH
jgi:hypothetical protein